MTSVTNELLWIATVASRMHDLATAERYGEQAAYTRRDACERIMICCDTIIFIQLTISWFEF